MPSGCKLRGYLDRITGIAYGFLRRCLHEGRLGGLNYDVKAIVGTHCAWIEEVYFDRGVPGDLFWISGVGERRVAPHAQGQNLVRVMVMYQQEARTRREPSHQVSRSFCG